MIDGFRRRPSAMAIALALLVLLGHRAIASPQGAGSGQAASAGAQAARAQAPPGKADVGATLYRKVGCYQCHVNEAQGGANGPKLGPDPVPFARFSQYVRKPTGDMPPYSEKVLSAQDIADIYAFVQSRPRPPALSTLPLLTQ